MIAKFQGGNIKQKSLFPQIKPLDFPEKPAFWQNLGLLVVIIACHTFMNR